MWAIAIFLATIFVAYANGANDNFKGVATLFGSETTNYKVAIWWATLTTFAGSIVSIILAATLIKNFSGKGLAANLVTAFLVIFASRFGVPVSTTHISVGAIFGVGTVSQTAHINVFTQVLMSWILTLPIAAILSSVIYFVI